MVHDADDETGVANALVRNGEGERFVEDRVERLLVYDRLLLLQSLTLVSHPDLHVRI